MLNKPSVNNRLIYYDLELDKYIYIYFSLIIPQVGSSGPSNGVLPVLMHAFILKRLICSATSGSRKIQNYTF